MERREAIAMVKCFGPPCSLRGEVRFSDVQRYSAIEEMSESRCEAVWRLGIPRLCQPDPPIRGRLLAAAARERHVSRERSRLGIS